MYSIPPTQSAFPPSSQARVGSGGPARADDHGPMDIDPSVVRVSDLLLRLEAGDAATFSIRPLVLSGAGEAGAFLGVRIDGERFPLTLAEAKLAADCLDDARPLAGADLRFGAPDPAGKTLAAAFREAIAATEALIQPDPTQPASDRAVPAGPAEPRARDQANPVRRRAPRWAQLAAVAVGAALAGALPGALAAQLFGLTR